VERFRKLCLLAHLRTYALTFFLGRKENDDDDDACNGMQVSELARCDRLKYKLGRRRRWGKRILGALQGANVQVDNIIYVDVEGNQRYK